MKAGRVLKWIFIAVGGLLPTGALASADFQSRLDRADMVRTSDLKEFTALLAQLDSGKDAATESQRMHLRLLHDYQHAIHGRYESAAGDAIALFDQTSDVELKYRAGLLVANVSAVTRDFSLGLRYLDRALQLQSKITNPSVKHTGFTVAGSLYNTFGQFELGRYYADQVLAQDPSPRSRCLARQIRVEALHGLGLPIDEGSDIQVAITECAAQKEPIMVGLVRNTLAQRWSAAGKTRQAVALLDASLPEVEETGYSWLIGSTRSLLAQYHLELGNTATAEVHARYVVGLTGQDARWLPKVMAHHVLYRIALGRRDYKDALDEYRAYAEADKARLDDVKAREYAFQLSRHELRQKNQSIALLSKRNDVLRLEQEVAKQAAQKNRLFVALLMLLVLWAGIWILRAKRLQRSLRNLAETDGLTGLANRRHFRARTEALLADCAERRQPVSLLLFDLDHFKQINDECGHAAGDWVLREVARVGRLHCRQGDLYGRIGGEEFAITLVDCDLDVALRIAEECRRAIAQIDAIPGGCTLPVSASVGCVGSSTSGYSYEKLIAHADAAMYRSKVAGRNRVSLYEASLARRPAHAGREPTPHLVGG